MKSKPRDPEYYQLIQDVFAKPILGHLYRGYAVLGQEVKQESEVSVLRHSFVVKFILTNFSIIRVINGKSGSSILVWEASGAAWSAI